MESIKILMKCKLGKAKKRITGLQYVLRLCLNYKISFIYFSLVCLWVYYNNYLFGKKDSFVKQVELNWPGLIISEKALHVDATPPVIPNNTTKIKVIFSPNDTIL